MIKGKSHTLDSLHHTEREIAINWGSSITLRHISPWLSVTHHIHSYFTAAPVSRSMAVFSFAQWRSISTIHKPNTLRKNCSRTTAHSMDSFIEFTWGGHWCTGALASLLILPFYSKTSCRCVEAILKVCVHHLELSKRLSKANGSDVERWVLFHLECSLVLSFVDWYQCFGGMMA